MYKFIKKIFVLVLILLSVLIQACDYTEADIAEISLSYDGEADKIFTSEEPCINENADRPESGKTYMEYSGNSVMVTKEPISYETDTNIDISKLVLLYSAGQDEISVYCYKNDSLNEDLGNLVLANSESYYVFPITIDMWMYDEDSVYYDYCDYDNDGYYELGAAMIFDRGTQIKCQKLLVYDYNEQDGDYNLYFLGIEDFSEDINSSIKLFYSNTYDIDYILERDNSSLIEIEGSFYNRFICENQNPILYGAYTSVGYTESNYIEYIISVAEALSERQTEGSDYIDIGSLYYDIDYSGNGQFIISANHYTEETHLRN